MIILNKPNVRNWFLPDPGYTIFDVDLQQADAQVVAWEANDETLKEIFRDPDRDLHDENCKTIFGSLTSSGRQLAKAGVHATNYYCTPKTLAATLGITTHQADQFQKKWFSAHPAIADWHKRVESQIQSTRYIENAFGFGIRFFDRIDRVLPEALAWVPQSTVARVINEGLNNLDDHKHIIPLLQVHDSVVGQFPDAFYPNRHEIQTNLLIEVPYPDPLTIGVDIKCSRRSWGHCKAVPWVSNETLCQY